MSNSISPSRPTNSIADERPVVLITGAAKRIGAAIAKKFHSEGFRIIIHYNTSHTQARLLANEFNERRPDSACCLRADLNHDNIENLATEAMAQYSRIDVLVNNASKFYATELANASLKHWDDLIDSNLKSAFYLCQALAPHLQHSQGAIVNVIDALVDSSIANHSIYSIAKAGLKSMTKVLAKDLAPRVRVNAVSPGAILWPELASSDQPHSSATAAGTDESNLQVEVSTEQLQSLQLPSLQLQNVQQQRIIDAIPLGHLGMPEDIAGAVYFLAVQASYMTGQTLKVDGGRSL